MIVWHLLVGVDHFIYAGGWVLILAGEMFLRHGPPRRRMQRGKYWRWTIRQFGPIWTDLPIRVFAAMSVLALFTATGQKWPLDVFYFYLVITAAVDWITGSEDPPWRKLSRAGAEILKKLRWQPAPQPVVNS
jgi:hypothetical protein